MRRLRATDFLFAFTLSLCWQGLPAVTPVNRDTLSEPDADAICATCHRAIYQRYRKTPMAQASGPAADGFFPADFQHTASEVRYKVTEEEGRVWLAYDRESPARRLHGRQELRFFLGSGRRGRTYLFEQQGYWFELPINWYAKKQIWDMAPNHLQDREMPLTLPVDPGCLKCHASQVALSLSDARNHYAGEPFAQGGITCTACHGDATTHVASQGRVRMLNLNGLSPARRLSICLVCHLEGDTTVIREGRRIEEFAPGDDLSDFEQVFVYRQETGAGGRATSQWEALRQSECWKASGDQMTCTTCHDPHESPDPAERVAFYREKCLHCHDQQGFAERHHPDHPDCSGCHMQRASSSDIAHEQVTDHFIRKHLPGVPPERAATGKMEAVGATPATDRDLGLAYAQMAARGDKAAGLRALELLRRVEKEDAHANNDDQLHAQLGFLEQVRDDAKDAALEYRHALAANPYDSLALGNLALLEAEQHQEREAVGLLRTLTERDPTQVAAGLNLAILACRIGDRALAVVALEQVLTFAPDDERARRLEAAIRSEKLSCAAH